MIIKKYRFLLFAALVISILIGGCAPVSAYQMMYVNDSQMELSAKKVEAFEISFQSYREGASGANGGKVGGGCGCN